MLTFSFPVTLLFTHSSCHVSFFPSSPENLCLLHLVALLPLMASGNAIVHSFHSKCSLYQESIFSSFLSLQIKSCNIVSKMEKSIAHYNFLSIMSKFPLVQTRILAIFLRTPETHWLILVHTVFILPVSSSLKTLFVFLFLSPGF